MKTLFIATSLILASLLAQPALAGPNIYAHHTMWILDQESFDALASVDFLKENFAGFRKQTVTTGETSWTAIYLTGEKTHLEFMSANPTFPIGTIGSGPRD